jgi:hypothetical protein
VTGKDKKLTFNANDNYKKMTKKIEDFKPKPGTENTNKT